MPAPRHDVLLIIGAALSGIAAALHLAVIAGGDSWYRFFGADDPMAMAVAATGHLWLPILTFGVACILAASSAYALSGAGVLRPLPLLRTVLVLVTGAYLLRGSLLVPALMDASAPAFRIWSSAICLGYGATHLAGLVQVWARLSNPVQNRSTSCLRNG